MDGHLVSARGGAMFGVTDPYTDRVIARVPDAAMEDVDAAVEATAAALPGWRDTNALERASLVMRFADAVEAHGEELALLDTIDAGSPISNARFDVSIALAQMRMYAGFALEMKGATIPASENVHLTLREPVGVTTKIFPTTTRSCLRVESRLLWWLGILSSPSRQRPPHFDIASG